MMRSSHTVKLFVVVVLVKILIPGTNGSPFLYSSAPLLLTSIFKASSTPDDPSRNVEDLREATDDDSKLDRLKADRMHAAQLEPDASANEATPQFVQKKLDKILYKLRLITQLSQTLGAASAGGGAENKPSSDGSDFDDFDFDMSNETTDNSVNVTQFTEKRNDSDTSTEAIVSTRPERFSLGFSSRDSNDVMKEDGTGSKVNPGSIGVYLMEMLGTVVTLIYGAALTLNNAANTTVGTQN